MIGNDEVGDDDPIEGMDIDMLEENIRESDGNPEEDEGPQSPWTSPLIGPEMRPPADIICCCPQRQMGITVSMKSLFVRISFLIHPLLILCQLAGSRC